MAFNSKVYYMHATRSLLTIAITNEIMQIFMCKFAGPWPTFSPIVKLYEFLSSLSINPKMEPSLCLTFFVVVLFHVLWWVVQKGQVLLPVHQRNLRSSKRKRWDVVHIEKVRYCGRPSEWRQGTGIMSFMYINTKEEKVEFDVITASSWVFRPTGRMSREIAWRERNKYKWIWLTFRQTNAFRLSWRQANNFSRKIKLQNIHASKSRHITTSHFTEANSWK